MSPVQTFQVGPLQTNCYFFTFSSTPATVIIDPGDDGDFLSEQIISQSLQPTLIFFTHGHFDHVAGALPLFLNFHPPVFLDPADLPLYRQANHSAHYFAGLTLDPIIPADKLTTDFSSISPLLPTSAQLLATPGHSPGLTALYLPRENLLFSGDLIFAHAGLGRTDFRYSDPQAMKKSLAKILTLPDKTHVYPGHGEDFILSDFKKDLALIS